MDKKTIITVECPDGHIEKHEADTVLAFTISDGGKFLEGKAQFLSSNVIYGGSEIPEQIMPITIASLIASWVHNRVNHNNKLTAADEVSELFEIARFLDTKRREAMKQADMDIEKEFGELDLSDDDIKNLTGRIVEDILRDLKRGGK